MGYETYIIIKTLGFGLIILSVDLSLSLSNIAAASETLAHIYAE